MCTYTYIYIYIHRYVYTREFHEGHPGPAFTLSSATFDASHAARGLSQPVNSFSTHTRTCLGEGDRFESQRLIGHMTGNEQFRV